MFNIVITVRSPMVLQRRHIWVSSDFRPRPGRTRVDHQSTNQPVFPIHFMPCCSRF